MGDFPRVLKVLRGAYDLTQYELAERSGTDQTYISLLETGIKPNPSERMIVRLVLGLNDSLYEADLLMVAAGYKALAPRWQALTRDEMLSLLKELEKTYPGDRRSLFR